MRKDTLSLSAAMIFTIIFLSVIAYAVGTSTGSSLDTANSTPQSENRTSTAGQENNQTSQGKNCEAKATRVERINCRLEQRGIEFNVTEESCRGLPNPNACQGLYAKVQSCYTFDGRQKDQCFKRIAGFIKSNAKEESNKTALRDYIVFLLYDLQERIEKSYESGEITNSTAVAESISLIVEIKQDIMLRKTKAEIRPKIQELKTKLRELRV